MEADVLHQVQTQFGSCRAGVHLGLVGEPSFLLPVPLFLSLAVEVFCQRLGVVWPQSHPSLTALVSGTAADQSLYFQGKVPFKGTPYMKCEV